MAPPGVSALRIRLFPPAHSPWDSWHPWRFMNFGLRLGVGNVAALVALCFAGRSACQGRAWAERPGDLEVLPLRPEGQVPLLPDLPDSPGGGGGSEGSGGAPCSRAVRSPWIQRLVFAPYSQYGVPLDHE